MELPFGAEQDIDFMFLKLIVHDIGKSEQFYKSVFGLVEMNRMEAKIVGRDVVEIVYQSTYKGGPLFILASFPEDTQPARNESIVGFASGDLDACLRRVEKAGGTVVEDREVPGFGRHAFVKDPEGHLLQISQRHG
ncbi:VOC family protein [Sphingobium sp. Cam5-1]|uniref:VOC family protein n=1 Tax=Sphingobium sp. Cam5-1 TaxID=2789327 RepID=UPI0018AD2B91|nr:VOC family protein [Sphingobium sp. Cam5-1]QPI75201.1 VOC family protein [Sphingobium sp. Cam5-1]